MIKFLAQVLCIIAILTVITSTSLKETSEAIFMVTVAIFLLVDSHSDL